MNLITKKLFLILFLMMLVGTWSKVWAVSKPTVSSDLHIGFGADNTTPPCNPTGCAGSPNVGPVGGTNTFSIYQNSGGAATSTYEYMFLAVPNQTALSFSTSSIIGVTSINTYPSGTKITTNTWSYLTSYSMPCSSPGQDLYTIVGLLGNNSNNCSNFETADSDLAGITATKYGIYEFQLDASLGPKGLVEADFATGIVPTGTIIVGYSCNAGDTKCYDNAFTEAGFQSGNQSVPEPSSLLLLGSGLFGLGLWGRKRFIEMK